MTERPYTDVAVIMRCEHINNRWQPWRWSLAEVVINEPAFGTAPRQILQDEREQRWLYPGFRVELFRDDTEGYHLNLTSPAPCWFVMWRRDEDTGTGAIPLARPVAVSLSYHDAGRWLDAQETVEQVQPSQLGPRLDQPVVVGGEYVQPIAHASAAGETHQEGDEGVEGMLALLVT